jgi:hypothetical protein
MKAGSDWLLKMLLETRGSEKTICVLASSDSDDKCR